MEETDLRRICDYYYALAYFLHPDPDVAYQLLQAGIKMAINTKRKISKRTASADPHKLPILEKDLLHYGILKASENFELYEEDYKFTSRRELSPFVSEYEPNTDDFLIRLIKTIYLNSFDRHPRYFAIGEGTQVFLYKTVDILSLSASFDNQNSSSIRTFFKKILSLRFSYLDLQNNLVPIDPPRAKEIIGTIRKQLALPSQNEYSISKNTNLATDYFGFRTEKDVREQLSVLMTCGIDSLITDYNRCFSNSSTERLEEPFNQLFIPSLKNTVFLSAADDFENRLQPIPLDQREQWRIVQNLRTNLPWLSVKDIPAENMKFVN